MDLMYDCWLSYGKDDSMSRTKKYFSSVCAPKGRIAESAVNELRAAAKRLFDTEPAITDDTDSGFVLRIDESLGIETYKTEITEKAVYITGGDENGILYGVFRFLILASGGYPMEDICKTESPAYNVRMIDHWDNSAGDIERGYSGRSIFFNDHIFTEDMDRIKDYARLLSSVGINACCINNVNVHKNETMFITDRYLDNIAAIAEIFISYGIKLYLSINFAAPIEVGGLDTADPLNEGVRRFWADTARKIYSHIPSFGGFLVKADSENRPGPFTYGRDHADGANMLADAVRPYGGIVIWRCFVYNCHVDWRDRTTDRARAAYDHFMPLDGKFADNVYLQIKNGPMDFQIREATSPLFGGLEKTNMFAELQIAQEYTGQQIDHCYLVPMWKECLDFDTRRSGSPLVKDRISGIAAVSNIGDSHCWTGDPLAGANLYGYGRLAFDPSLSARTIAEEWTRAAVTTDEKDSELITGMLLESREIYEQ
ncbi:MAG: alpha-glucuronidase, partial [Ruminococcus sp.]|nr:alpha-glucuronidase [Ruminococcus sp.]